MQFLETNINIAGVDIKVQVEQGLKNVFKLFDNFSKSRVGISSVGTIKICYNRSMKIQLAQDFQRLTISGPNLNDIKNHFNLIAILCFTFRFIGLHSIKKGYLLLHASAAISKNGKAFIFGDDGQSHAKTLSSMELAFSSKKYIGDEWVFYDISKRKIYGFPFAPIHLRPRVEKHLGLKHNIRFSSSITRSEAGIFINISKMFKYIPNAELGGIVYVYFTGEAKLQKLSPRDAEQSFKICALAQPLKFFNPSLERMKFAQKEDSMRIVSYPPELIEKLAEKFQISSLIETVAQQVPSYKVFLKEPCDLIDLLPT